MISPRSQHFILDIKNRVNLFKTLLYLVEKHTFPLAEKPTFS